MMMKNNLDLYWFIGLLVWTITTNGKVSPIFVVFVLVVLFSKNLFFPICLTPIHVIMIGDVFFFALVGLTYYYYMVKIRDSRKGKNINHKNLEKKVIAELKSSTTHRIISPELNRIINCTRSLIVCVCLIDFSKFTMKKKKKNMNVTK